MFCAPKFGDIFVPAIAAAAFTSAFTIVPFKIAAASTLFDARLPVIVILLPPLKLALPVTSPHNAIVLAVCSAVAVPAFPLILPLIVLLNVFIPPIVCAVLTSTPSVIPYPDIVVGRADIFANGIAIFDVPSKLTPAIVLAV